MREEPHPITKHHDHASQTVMHHPEEKETILAGWLRRGLAKGPIFWVGLGGVLVAAIAAVVASNVFMPGESTNAKAWMELALARTPEQQERVADDHPNTEAAKWALLDAAGSVYDQGFKQLSVGREVASPFLKRAYSLYSKAYEESQKSEPVIARLALLGMARSLEASGDIPGAIEKYKELTKTWPGTDEATEAEHYAKRLSSKQGQEFYAWLANYKAPEALLPPKGQGTLDLPSALGTDGLIPPSGPLPELPDNVFTPSDASETQPKPPATPPSEPAPTPPKP
jgi:hypothetical protein